MTSIKDILDHMGIEIHEPEPIESRIEKAKVRAAAIGESGIDEYFSEAGLSALEQYLVGRGACSHCTSLDECTSPYSGHEPVLSWNKFGRGAMSLRPCPKKAQMEAQAAHDSSLLGAAVPRGYAQMGFKGFRVGEGSKNAVAACLALARGERGGLILWGPTGTGKTHLAVATLRNRMEAGATGAYLSAPEVVDRMRGDFGEAAQKVLDSVGSVDLLLIDDLGAERRTEYVLESVFRIIDRRLSCGLPTIVTTNYSREALAVRYGGVEGERIVSRLSGLGDWLEVQGIDGREARAHD